MLLGDNDLEDNDLEDNSFDMATFL